MRWQDSTRHLVRNCLRPAYVGPATHKVLSRWGQRQERSQEVEARRWAGEHAEPVAGFAARIEPELWAEAEAFGAELATRGRALLREHYANGIRIGGGGEYRFLHFVTRLTKPTVVAETGVAAGFSSEAILGALDANGAGELWSSDLPYLGFPDPERFVGLVVDPARRDRWHLFLRGDRANLKAILPAVDHIDLFHYDSDKTAAGRTFALDAVAPKLAEDATVVIDDIDDNLWFRDWVTRTGRPFRVFQCDTGTKPNFVGLVGPLASV